MCLQQIVRDIERVPVPTGASLAPAFDPAHTSRTGAPGPLTAEDVGLNVKVIQIYIGPPPADRVTFPRRRRDKRLTGTRRSSPDARPVGSSVHRHPGSCLRGDGGLRARSGAIGITQGDRSPSDNGMDLGILDAGRGHQLVSHSSDPTVGAVEPNPFALNFHAGDLAARRPACTRRQNRQPPMGDAQSVLWADW